MLTDFIKSLSNQLLLEEEKEKENILSGILENPEIEKAILCLQHGNIDRFRYTIAHDVSKITNSIIDHAISNQYARVLVKNYSFFEDHFTKLIKLKDGFASSHDKVITILKSIFKYYEHGDEIKFNYDAEYTFHLPVNYFTTQNQIIDYYQSLVSLLYGDFNEYIIELQKVITSSESLRSK